MRVNPVTVVGKKKNIGRGLVNGIEVDILFDSGADFSVVPKSLISDSMFLRTLLGFRWKGAPTRCEMACTTFIVNGKWMT